MRKILAESFENKQLNSSNHHNVNSFGFESVRIETKGLRSMEDTSTALWAT